MPLKSTSFNEHPLCFGFTWHIGDEAKLAQLVALLLAGHYRHVIKVLGSLPGVPPPTTEEAIDHLITAMGPPTTNDQRYQRDGWVFQMISWVAAQLLMNKDVAASIPHPRPSNKGFDGLLVELTAGGGTLVGVVVCEDKATENPRQTIRQLVWPEFSDCEAGHRDFELQSEITLALERYGAKNVDTLIQSIFWKGKLKYRIMITAPKTDSSVARKQLFKNYRDIVGGKYKRRRAEILTLDDLRGWMDAFCKAVILKLEAVR